MTVKLTEQEKKMLDYLLTKHWGYLEFDYSSYDKEQAKQGQELLLSIKSKLLKEA